jgi:hypothetical protein
LFETFKLGKRISITRIKMFEFVLKMKSMILQSYLHASNRIIAILIGFLSERKIETESRKII